MSIDFFKIWTPEKCTESAPIILVADPRVGNISSSASFSMSHPNSQKHVYNFISFVFVDKPLSFAALTEIASDFEGHFLPRRFEP